MIYYTTVCEVPSHLTKLSCAYAYATGVYTFTITALSDFVLEKIETIKLNIYGVAGALAPVTGITYSIEV